VPEKMERFTQRARHALSLANEEARRLEDNSIGPQHILLGLLHVDGGVARHVLHEIGIDAPRVGELIEQMTNSQPRIQDIQPELSPETKQVIEQAIIEARQMGHNYVGTEHLLLGLLGQDKSMALDILKLLNIGPKVVQLAVLRALRAAQLPNEPAHIGNLRTRWKSSLRRNRPSITPITDQISIDLTAFAKEEGFDPVIGRDFEIERIGEILARRTNNGVLLIGATGVGKTAIILGLAQQIADKTASEWFSGKRVLLLYPSDLIAGTVYRGQFEERLKNIILEAKPEKIILFLDQVQMLIPLIIESDKALSEMLDERVPDNKRWTAAEIFKPALENGSINLIGAMTPEEYIELTQVDPVLARRFQTIRVNEPSTEEATQILQAIKSNYEIYHQVKISDEALEAAVHLSFRFLPAAVLPGKAIGLIDEAASRVHLHRSQEPDPQVSAQDIAEVVALTTGKSISEINDTDAK